MLRRRQGADLSPGSGTRPLVDPARAAPAVPSGWVIGPPDFVGVGAQRCGTSWWCSLLLDHPGVSRPAEAPKEVHFFDRFCGEPFEDAHADEYASHFPKRPGTVTGEWTPRYLFDFWAPPLLARAAPDARILVLLRDPVERYRSGIFHMRWLEAPDWFVASDAFARGLYHEQLVRLFDVFSRERVLVLQYERCVADPEPQLRRTFEHVGLDWHPPADLTARVNPGGDDAEVPPAVAARLRELYRPENERLAELVDVDLELWR